MNFNIDNIKCDSNVFFWRFLKISANSKSLIMQHLFCKSGQVIQCSCSSVGKVKSSW